MFGSSQQLSLLKFFQVVVWPGCRHARCFLVAVHERNKMVSCFRKSHSDTSETVLIFTRVNDNERNCEFKLQGEGRK